MSIFIWNHRNHILGTSTHVTTFLLMCSPTHTFRQQPHIHSLKCASATSTYILTLYWTYIFTNHPLTNWKSCRTFELLNFDICDPNKHNIYHVKTNVMCINMRFFQSAFPFWLCKKKKISPLSFTCWHYTTNSILVFFFCNL